jgi:hypothetical protein
MAIKVVNFADDPAPHPPKDVCDYLTPIERREGDISAVNGFRLKGLVLRATTQHRGEFQRIGMFDSESPDVIELLQSPRKICLPGCTKRERMMGDTRSLSYDSAVLTRNPDL